MIRDERWVVRACRLGMFIQALVINLTPLLFIPLRDQFGLSFEQIGRLILINFLTQMVVDLLCTALADRMPIKPLIVGANALAAAGLWVFAAAPFVLENPYHGLVLGTVVFSIGCGLLEVLLSPIINAVPSPDKSASMAFLHAFYPIGKVAVIIVTGLSLQLAGIKAWPAVVALWSVFPIMNTGAFLIVKVPPLADPETRSTLRSLLATPGLYFLLAGMVLSGATEVTMAQWTSAYVETALGFPKFTADLVGFCLFGVGMIIGRLWFGMRGEHGNLWGVMMACAICSTATYLAMALIPLPWLALFSTLFSGFFVSMLWPGTISLSAAKFPLAGASLFALLAAAGDAGGAFMPWLVGVIADLVSAGQIPGLPGDPTTSGMKTAFLVSAAWPFMMAFVLLFLSKTHSAPDTYASK